MKTDSIMPQRLLPFPTPKLAMPAERNGVIYTKPWVVELLLDLAGYVPSANLVDCFAVEPAAGEGAFLLPMARRLIASFLREGRSLGDCQLALAGIEIVSGKRAGKGDSVDYGTVPGEKCAVPLSGQPFVALTM
jgi:hypothetical protein